MYPEVKLFGVKYPFLFGMGALLAFKRKFGDMKTGELMLKMQDLPPKQYDWLIYSALKCGSDMSGKWFWIPFFLFKLYVRWFPGFYDRLDACLLEQLPEDGKKKAENQANP